jgi:hypothetical protein
MITDSHWSECEEYKLAIGQRPKESSPTVKKIIDKVLEWVASERPTKIQGRVKAFFKSPASHVPSKAFQTGYFKANLNR